jgi:hypothetical protein
LITRFETHVRPLLAWFTATSFGSSVKVLLTPEPQLVTPEVVHDLLAGAVLQRGPREELVELEVVVVRAHRRGERLGKEVGARRGRGAVRLGDVVEAAGRVEEVAVLLEVGPSA